MSLDRTEGRRAHHRALRPTLDGGLESRCLLAHSNLAHVSGAAFLANSRPGFASLHNNPPFTTLHTSQFDARSPLTPHHGAQTTHGGRTVVIFQDGGAWTVSLNAYSPAISAGGSSGQATTTRGAPHSSPFQVPGTVHAHPLPGGQWGLTVDGSTTQTELDIKPAPFHTRKGSAHAFGGLPRVLKIGAIIVTSGQIGAIQGFQTADLSGPITINGKSTVDWIALNSIQPGGSITTGGTVNTLDVANGIDLSGGPSINIGRDLNLLNVGQDINLSNGSSIFVGRTLGALPQPPKGTSTGSNILAQNQTLVGTTSTIQFPNVAAFIQGDVNVGPGSTFSVGRGIGVGAVIYIQGNVTFAGNIFIPNGVVATTLSPLNGNVLFNGVLTPIP